MGRTLPRRRLSVAGETRHPLLGPGRGNLLDDVHVALRVWDRTTGGLELFLERAVEIKAQRSIGTVGLPADRHSVRVRVLALGALKTEVISPRRDSHPVTTPATRFAFCAKARGSRSGWLTVPYPCPEFDTPYLAGWVVNDDLTEVWWVPE
jgi:hypothetical protein